MNLSNLKELESAATAAPWFHIPWMLNPRGLPILQTGNQQTILAARNLLPLYLELTEACDGMARAFRAVRDSIVDGKPTPATEDAQMALLEAQIGVLRVHAQLHNRMGEL